MLGYGGQGCHPAGRRDLRANDRRAWASTSPTTPARRIPACPGPSCGTCAISQTSIHLISPRAPCANSTIVIVDAKNFDKIEQALGPGYYRIDYIRMWWPNQDYFGLVSDRQPGSV